jgi:hypothetical protein
LWSRSEQKTAKIRPPLGITTKSVFVFTQAGPKSEVGHRPRCDRYRIKTGRTRPRRSSPLPLFPVWPDEQTTRGTNLRNPRSINEAIETPRKFPEMCEMILQLRKPLRDIVEVLITTREFRAGSCNGLAIINPPDEKYP